MATVNVKKWSSFRSQIVLLAITLACLLPFSGKAFHIDDPLFLWSAKQITKHPLDPFGFKVLWDITLTPMSEVTKNPPLACYYAAAIGAVAGWSERVLHLWFLVPSLALVLGTYRLAQLLTKSPLIAAAATLLTPGMLVSATGIMCDTLMLAFWVWAIILWMDGLSSDKAYSFFASVLLVSAAALTKYFGICLVPLLFAYSLVRQRRPRLSMLWLALPLLALAGYEVWSRALYGHGMFFAALAFAPQRLAGGSGRILLYALICASFSGGCTLSALALAPLTWCRKHIVAALILEGLAGAIAWALLRGSLPAIRLGLVLQERWKIAGPELALYIASAFSILALVAVDLWGRRNADSLLLALWVFGTFVFTAFLNWVINARSVLPLIPAAGILMARRLDSRGIASSRMLRVGAALALLASGLVSLWVAQADTDWANSGRQADLILRQRTEHEAGAVWFQGHWGFQYYMQQSGLQPFDFSRCTLRPGDLLIIPINNVGTRNLPQTYVASEQLVEIKLRQPMITQNPRMAAGFYASYFGFLPFTFGRVPPEQYRLIRIGAEVRPEQWR